jgi:predicted unusual protein kinase regulating ubiquinone biosynthesis (AarF/ABC1/UbiB family)
VRRITADFHLGRRRFGRWARGFIQRGGDGGAATSTSVRTAAAALLGYARGFAMSITVRFFRACLTFGVIFISYLWMMALERLFGRNRPWIVARWKKVHTRNARRLYRGIVKLRGVYIKLGQVLSIMGNFLPRAYARELEGLQDHVPPAPFRDIERAITEALSKRPTEVFAEFDERPLAAASLGQVHRAVLKTGEKVAVKVLYPNVKAIIAVDLRVMGYAIVVYKWFVPIAQIERVVDQLRDLLERETDYVHEGQCMERLAKNFVGQDDILFPRVFWDYTRKNVLVMTFMEGVKISRKDELAKMGVDPEQVAKRLVESFYKQLFVDRVFHADPHPGNFLVQPGPKIVFLDFGAVSEVKQSLLDGAFDVLKGMMMRQDSLVMQGIEQMGFMSKDGDRKLLEATIKTYFQKLLKLDIRDFGKIKPDAIAELSDPGLERAELRQLMKSVEYPDGWFFVERSAVILFGLSAHLAPTLNTVMVGMPYAMSLMAEKMSRPQAASSSAVTGGPGAPTDPAASPSPGAA